MDDIGAHATTTATTSSAPDVASAPAPAMSLASPAAADSPPPIAPGVVIAPERLRSLDAYRGFIMLLMATGGLGLGKILANDLSTDFLFEKITYQFEHTSWSGCSLWDLIQPAFMFMVGVAMPFSYARRRAQGQPWLLSFGHAALRAVVLVALGVFLASQGHKHTEFLFTNVLAQIGLGYLFVFLLLGRGPVLQGTVALVILAVYWFLFARHPLPPKSFNWHAVGVTQDMDCFYGFYAHWAKNANFASAFDQWFLNLFPRPESEPFVFNPGGYTTLNFVPSIATMIFGLMTGELLRRPWAPRQKLLVLLVGGALGIVGGSMLDKYHFCPIVKRIWTPAWALYGGGWVVLMLAAFYWLIDCVGLRKWAFPLIVVGMNSIAIYMMSQLMKPWVASTLRIHFGQDIFKGTFGPLYQSLAVVGVLWLFCFYMYRRKIFIKI